MSLSEKLKKIFNDYFYWLVIMTAIIETASYFGHIFPDWERLFFIFIAGLILILCLKNIKYGIWAAALELVIGSKGYLFSLDIGGAAVSIRITIWLILISVWAGFFLSSFFKKNPEDKSIFLKAEFWKKGYLPYFIILFFFIAFGFINGVIRGNDFSNVFFDANGWLYFALIFPFFESIFNKKLVGEKPLAPMTKIFAVGIAWLFIKTLILLFFFSHVIPETNPWHNFLFHELYRWVRDTGVGEITMMPSGFVRIFFQSHLFALAAFYFILMAIPRFWGEIKASRKFLAFFLFAQTAALFMIMISFSRSFWVGLAAAAPLWLIVAWKKYGLKRLSAGIAITTIAFFLAASLTAGTIKFPYPEPGVDFNIADALADRAGKLSGEAAVSSRYALLPELWNAIRLNPILGGGFGKTISYHTSDPRILESSPDGLYATYAFEWGWLDIWLKIGLLGAVFYLFFFGKIIKDALGKEDWLADSLAISLLLLAAVNFFTPYANHPLGIGLFLFAAAAVYLDKKFCSCA
jgi:hypothetical protein